MQNPILTAANAALKVTNYLGNLVTRTLSGVPLGTVGGSVTGELGVKVIVVSTTGTITLEPSNLSTAAKQDALLAIVDRSTTPNFVLLSASSNQVIPVGAKGWSVTFLTGTGIIGGVAVPAGFSDSDPNKLAVTITVVTNAASTAYIRWNI